jgi:hypothetical protein
MIYYAHTGGYTELGGIEEFLKKMALRRLLWNFSLK